MTTTAAVEVRGLRHGYGSGPGAVQALAGIDLALPRGSFTAIMGPSGSGKSTLLACLAGLQQPSAGKVVIAGEDVSSWGEARRTRLRRDRIGMVFQDFHLLPYLTAEQNVGLPLRLAGTRGGQSKVADLLDRVALTDRAHHLPAELSGGQQQRVAIARALVRDPAVVLADEPTGALDSRTATQVLRLLRDCVDQLGQTVLMVTHDPRAASWADTVVFLADGQLAGQLDHPDPDEVARRLAHLDQVRGEGGRAA